MQKIVPATAPDARNLAGVAPEMLRSLRGSGTWLAPATSAVAFVIDGLGASQLRGHAAYARSLAGAMPRRHVTHTVFPSTTAAALGSFLTGELPGTHGLVGYRTLDPDRDVLANQLNGYERDGLDPDTWQRSRTVFQAAADRGIRGFAVGAAEYATTGLTSALMRGAEFVAEDDLAQRVRLAGELAAQHPGSFVYCYIPDIDKVGHRRGIDSDEWRGTLEEVDAAMRPALSPRRGVGVVVTADHGMVDVPRTRHVLLADGDRRLDGVRHIGGEPRLLHLYVDPGVDAADVARTWRDASGRTADVSTRAEAITDALFGLDVLPHVRERIGDVIVAARGRWAFYDDRLREKGPQNMIGQHGSTTPEETTVPLIRAGAYEA